MRIKEITTELIEQSMDYKGYRLLIDGLLAREKTTGNNHSQAMLEYTRQNIRRMKRLDKHTQLSEELLYVLQRMKRKTIWLVLTEAWCGDAAQTLPVMAKAADSCNASLSLILRDEHLSLMDQFLTHGGRSIPKLLILDAESLELIQEWGPRPEPAQYMVLKSIASGEDYHERHHDLHLWYGKDRTKTFQSELSNTLSKIVS